MSKYIRETDLFLVKYPVPYRAPDRELANLPALFREMDFEPRRVTVRKRNVKVLGGFLEFNTNSVIFEE